MATDLVEKWKDNEAEEEPDNYQPEVCPPGLAKEWTNTENPGNSDHGKWEWDLLVDLAYVANSNPTTIKENVETLLEAVLTEEEKEKLRDELRREMQ